MIDFEDQFDAYLNNELNTNEKALFEKALTENIELKKDFEAHKLAINAINKSVLIDLKTEMKSWDSDLKNKKSNLKFYISLAASIVLIATFYLALKPNKTTQLFNQYYTTYPNVLTVRNSNSNSTQELMQLYSNKQYSTFVNACLQKENLSDTLLFYVGISQMELKDYSDAVLTFKQVQDTTDFKLLADFYTALGYLAANKKDEAIILLNEISDREQGTYAKKARDIIESLR